VCRHKVNKVRFFGGPNINRIQLSWNWIFQENENFFSPVTSDQMEKKTYSILLTQLKQNHLSCVFLSLDKREFCWFVVNMCNSFLVLEEMFIWKKVLILAVKL